MICNEKLLSECRERFTSIIHLVLLECILIGIGHQFIGDQTSGMAVSTSNFTGSAGLYTEYYCQVYSMYYARTAEVVPGIPKN